jgi:hypothetical protein
MMNAIAFLLPDSMIVLVIMGVGIAMILGVNHRKSLGLLGSLLLCLILSPFIEAVFAVLPMWITALVLFVAGMQILRSVLGFVFGSEAAGHIIGGIVLAFLFFTARVLFMPLRLAGRGVGRLVNGRYS